MEHVSNVDTAAENLTAAGARRDVDMARNYGIQKTIFLQAAQAMLAQAIQYRCITAKVGKAGKDSLPFFLGAKFWEFCSIR